MPKGMPISASVEDNSDLVFANRVSTLKLRIRNVSKEVIPRVYLTPPSEYWEENEVKGKYEDVQLIWGGGVSKGCLVMLPGDRTELEPGNEGVAYFLVYPQCRRSKEVSVPLNVLVDDEQTGRVNLKLKVVWGDPRAYVYRPRYTPLLNESMLPLVRRVVEEYGVPDVETRVWPLDISSTGVRPKVEILFEGMRVAVITGDVGSGFMHVSKIRVHRDVFVAEGPSPEGLRRWYWVARVWFFWLDRSVFDEVPDAERVELWINPDTEKVDWLVTDAHWKEVAYRGPVECAEVKITSGVRGIFSAKIARLVRSYHPPQPVNMRIYRASDDSRDPRLKVFTLQYF